MNETGQVKVGSEEAATYNGILGRLQTMIDDFDAEQDRFDKIARIDAMSAELDYGDKLVQAWGGAGIANRVLTAITRSEEFNPTTDFYGMAATIDAMLAELERETLFEAFPHSETVQPPPRLAVTQGKVAALRKIRYRVLPMVLQAAERHEGGR